MSDDRTTIDTQPLKPEGGPMSDLLTVTIPGTSVLGDERVEAIRAAAENLLGELSGEPECFKVAAHVYLICDECGAKGARRATGQAAREACEAVGWVTAGNRDHCPDCAKRRDRGGRTMSDADMIETVTEALAGVTITDPDFEGLDREDWQELAVAALKAVRAVDAKAPEGADLAYLSDRARAYVVGLEARLKVLRQENDELRAKLADPSQRDEKAIRGAYERGWRDCAAKLANKTQAAIQSLTRCHDAALADYIGRRPAHS